jgi:hypothetical protein
MDGKIAHISHYSPGDLGYLAEMSSGILRAASPMTMKFRIIASIVFSSLWKSSTPFFVVQGDV